MPGSRRNIPKTNKHAEQCPQIPALAIFTAVDDIANDFYEINIGKKQRSLRF